MTTLRTPRRDTASPELDLAEGFGQQVRRWSLNMGASGEAAEGAGQAARAVSLATSAGHVCITLPQLLAEGGLPLGDAESARLLLRASGMVSTADEPGNKPLVLDADDRLYLHKSFDNEQRLARRLWRCNQGLQEPSPAAMSAMARHLAALFPNPDGAVDWQALAAALAWLGRLTVISGGPGTGKTTTVVNLLACILAQQPDARIVLAAPTGKAAARMAEALNDRAQHLPAPLRAAMPSESFTIHRLLGVRPQGGFAHDAQHPLALDALIVDEASMLDLSLARQLFEAVPDHARIVLLGDKDQLSAVEAGAVFADLSADPSLDATCRARLAALLALDPGQILCAPALRQSALQNSAVWFNRNFRFASDSGIGRLAADIVHGRRASLLDWLLAAHDPSVNWVADGADRPSEASLSQLAEGFAHHVAACQAAQAAGPGPQTQAALHSAFLQFRVLCAVKDSPRGVDAVNQWLDSQLRPQLARPSDPDDSPWFAGRPVMVTRNDAGLKLFNGDVGITWPDPSGELMVYFPTPDAQFRAVAPARLPQHQTAWAMTVHKSQGSEFNKVLVLLPAQRSKVLSRELLYTAVTRARSHVTLIASQAVLEQAIDSPSLRQSGLLARLADCAADGAPIH